MTIRINNIKGTNAKIGVGMIFISAYLIVGVHYFDLPTINLVGDVSLRTEAIMFMIALPFALMTLMLKREKISRDYLFAIAYPSITLFYVFYGLIISKNTPHRVFFEYQVVMFYYSFILAVIFLKGKKEILYIVKILIYGSVLYLPFLFLQYYLASFGIYFLSGKEAIMVSMLDLNRFVPQAQNILLIASFFMFARMLDKYNIKYIILSLLMLFSLILTYSRNIWISCMLGMLVVIWYEKRALYKRLPLSVFIFVMSIMLFYLFMKDTVIMQNLIFRFGMISTTVLDTDISLKWRVIETEAAMKSINESPLMGHGLGYRYHFMEAFKSAGYFVHNNYLLVLMKTGIAGITALFLFFYVIIKASFYVYKANQDDEYLRCISIATVAYMAATIPSAIVKPTFTNDSSAVIPLAVLLGAFIKLKAIDHRTLLSSLSDDQMVKGHNA